MNDASTPTGAGSPPQEAAPAAPAAPALLSDHPVAPVFSVPAFLLVLVGVVVAGAGAPIVHAALLGRA
ncbi:MAG TPA: hypothetical protein VFP50_04080, partial [Anaeromyxobacteraceae bacterium]|nr:hypothetical protein [Anaeromyxobacteraceae bacterium]